MCDCNNLIYCEDMGYHCCMDCGLVKMDNYEYDFLSYGDMRMVGAYPQFVTTTMGYSHKFKNIYEIHKDINSNLRSMWYYYTFMRVSEICSCGKKLMKGSMKSHLKRKIHFDRLNGVEKENMLEEITCECGNEMLKQNLKLHLKLKIHFNRMKEKEIGSVPKRPVGRPKKPAHPKVERVTYENNKEIIIQRNLDYYYKTGRTKMLKKVTCECGNVITKGNLKVHLKSNMHARRLREKVLHDVK